jgi:hypothetical protein
MKQGAHTHIFSTPIIKISKINNVILYIQNQTMITGIQFSSFNIHIRTLSAPIVTFNGLMQHAFNF